MRTRVRHLWTVLSTSYWFVPSAMMLVAAAAAFGMATVDRWGWLAPRGALWVYGGGHEGARAMLATIAGSVVTVAGVGYSITIVTLTQASSQFGPRLLRNFMQDRGNQVVLGVWVSTFVYGILVLRTIRGPHDGEGSGGGFVPHASVTLAVVLAVVSVVALVYFIHHVSFSLQAPQVVAGVGRQLQGALARTFPSQVGREGAGAPEVVVAQGPADDGRPVPAPRSGYLEVIDEQALMRVARADDLCLRLRCRPGDFLIAGTPMLLAHPADRAGGATTQALQKAFVIGDQATPEQDVEFLFEQIVEIGLRALSPGINDPFTAIHCLDWLGASLGLAVECPLPSAYRYDESGRLRVVARVTDFAGLVNAAFDQLRQAAASHVSVTIRLLEVAAMLAGRLRTREQAQALQRQAWLAYRAGTEAAGSDEDRADIAARYREAARALATVG